MTDEQLDQYYEKALEISPTVALKQGVIGGTDPLPFLRNIAVQHAKQIELLVGIYHELVAARNAGR